MSLAGLLGRGFFSQGGGSVGSISLSAADDADGTGFTATLSGSSGGTIEVFYAAWSGGLVGASWVSAGTRVGDGTLAVNSGDGFFWLYAIETSGGSLVAVSTVVGGKATSGSDSVLEQCLDATVTKIKALGLTGITSTNVVKQKLPWNLQSVSAGVYVTPVPETVTAKMNERDDIGYGVQVTLFEATNRSLTSNLTDELNWRQKVSRAFRHRALAGVAEIFTCHVEPGPVVDIESFQNQFDAQSLILRFMSREVRGV